jgi:hypothetical protein
MATRGYTVGSQPPQVTWTIVRGDTASFRVYVTDDARQPINVPDWTIDMDITRLGSIVTSLIPEATIDDDDGEFTVSLTSAQTESLETEDLFDIQLTDATRVWTVVQGSMIVIEDVTGPSEQS